jgi:hypothetical protein
MSTLFRYDSTPTNDVSGSVNATLGAYHDGTIGSKKVAYSRDSTRFRLVIAADIVTTDADDDDDDVDEEVVEEEYNDDDKWIFREEGGRRRKAVAHFPPPGKASSNDTNDATETMRIMVV